MNAPRRELLAHEFAVRTRQNLEFIECGSKRFGADVYEVTQLINSTMGILLFPVELIMKQTSQEFPEAMKEVKWQNRFKIINNHSKKYTKGWTQEERFLKLLRNAFAHGNIDLGKDGKNIEEIRLWNFPGNSREYPKDVDWEIVITVKDLRIILMQVVKILERHLLHLREDGVGVEALSNHPDLVTDVSEEAAD